jgi:hypothetical protein
MRETTWIAFNRQPRRVIETKPIILDAHRLSPNPYRRPLNFIPSPSIPYTFHSILFLPLQFPPPSSQFYSFPFNCPLRLLESIPSPSIVRPAFFFPFEWSILFGLLLDFPASINALSRSPILFHIALETMLVDSLGVDQQGLECKMKGNLSLKMVVPDWLIFY